MHDQDEQNEGREPIEIWAEELQFAIDVVVEQTLQASERNNPLLEIIRRGRLTSTEEQR